MPPKQPVSPGDRYGRLTVLECAGKHQTGQTMWHCQCDCGKTTIATETTLVRGDTKSCGCIRTTKARANKKHGHASITATKKPTPTYKTWSQMLHRCQNPQCEAYARYGGRGITVCDRWQDFTLFLADMGERPTDKTLDRINNNQGYYPENCRWATKKQQQRNRRDNNQLRYQNQEKTVAEWAEIHQLNARTIKSRLRAGWTAAESLTTPARKRTKT